MWKSTLLIDVGDNPDRPRPGRLWLRNLYHVHQRLCMAFPSAERQRDDGHFLKPYKPDDFPEDRYLADRKQGDGDQEVRCEVLKQVHRPRDNKAGFLFRLDPQGGGRVVIVVQSARWPNWEYAFGLKDGLVNDRGQPIGNAGHLLAARPEVEPFNPQFATGQRLRFCLVANPTRKVGTIRQEERQRHTKDELRQIKGRNGRRVPVPSSEEISAWCKKNPQGEAREFISLRLMEWLESKAEPSGFSLQSVSVQPGYTYFENLAGHRESGHRAAPNSDGEGHRARLRAVRYEGDLTVTDPACFGQTLIRGIGSGKAFGFGLLSVAAV